MRAWFVLLLILISGCNNAPSPPSYTLIYGRDNGDNHTRPPLYQVVLQEGWNILPTMGSVADTKQPLLECLYQENLESLRLTIHNFSYPEKGPRPSLLSQLNRWKRQFDKVTFQTTSLQAFAGFVGFHLYAEGFIEEKNIGFSAWALQLALPHRQSLTLLGQGENQILSDVTIKVTGPLSLMEKHQEAIVEIARSLELLNPLPNP